MTLRVLLVDDHLAFADSLSIAISMQDDMECLGTAGSVDEALAIARRQPPDIVLMDVDMPGTDGLEGTALMKSLCPDAKVLILTGRADLAVMAKAADAGANGFLPKQTRVKDVLDAIHAVSDDRMLVDGGTLSFILEQAKRAEQRTHAPPSGLTARELSVLALMGEGMDPQTIARELSITIGTCRGYVKAILAKLGARSQLEAVVKAMRTGLLTAPGQRDG